VQSNTVAQASAAHRPALAANLALFPKFLEQLGPSSERLGRLAEQEIPTFRALGIAAPAINRTFANLAPFSNSSSAFFQSLGNTSQRSGPALVATQPLLKRLNSLGAAANPTASNLSALLTSLRDTGGLERILDFIFLGAGTTNGYDSLGHFLRAEGIANQCISYFIEPKSGCSARLFNTRGLSTEGAEGSREGTAARAAAAGASPSTSVLMARTLAVLSGATPAQSVAQYPEPVQTSLASNAGQGSEPAAAHPGSTNAATTYYNPPPEAPEAGGMLLNYLLGD
jgi:hypothetical protein